VPPVKEVANHGDARRPCLDDRRHIRERNAATRHDRPLPAQAHRLGDHRQQVLKEQPTIQTQDVREVAQRTSRNAARATSADTTR
jgi:hypothetical protein